jgi:hypothetical protein
VSGSIVSNNPLIEVWDNRTSRLGQRKSNVLYRHRGRGAKRVSKVQSVSVLLGMKRRSSVGPANRSERKEDSGQEETGLNV